MTKTELLLALEGKFHIVLELMAVKVITPTLNFYRVKVFDLVNGGLRDQSISFYVEDEGEPSEAAYWSPAEPKKDPAPDGPAKLVAEYLDSKVTDGSIRAYIIEGGSLNVTTKSVVVNALKNDLTWQQFLVEYVAGSFQLTPIP